MPQPLLTIAIPTFNRAKLLDRCLEYMLSQINDDIKNDIELIVSDNDSKDNTADIVNKYIQKGFAIRYSKNIENVGPDRNIAGCFLKATAKYVWIFSDDDFLLPGYLPHIVDVLKSGDFGNVFLPVLPYNGSGFNEPPKACGINHTSYNEPLVFEEKVNFSSTLITSNIVNKSLFTDLGYVEEFYDSYLVQLSWILPAIFSGKENIYITEQTIACQVDNTGGYRLFEVFGKNLNFVVNKLIKMNLVNKKTKDIINKHLLKSFFPVYITSPGKKFKNENAFKSLMPVFWMYGQFWFGLVPKFFVVGSVKRLKSKTKSSIKGFLAKLLAWVNNSEEYIAKQSNNRTFISQHEKKDFKFFGENSFISLPKIVLNPQYISIGANFFSLYNLRLETYDSYGDQKFTPELIIGDNFVCSTDVHIGCINKIVIGNNVLLGSRIYISDHSHGEVTKEALAVPPFKRPLVSKGPVVIGDNVWIGEGVCIMPGVTIGENTIIGANAVVTKSFGPNLVIGGIPAAVIKNLE